jgi:hypothetical protein
VWARHIRPAQRAAAAQRAKLAADRDAVVSAFVVPEGDASPGRLAAERRAWWAREGADSRIRLETLARTVSRALDAGQDEQDWLDAEGRADVATWRGAGGLPAAGDEIRWLEVAHDDQGDRFDVALGRRVLRFRRAPGAAAFVCWRVRAGT